MRLGWLNTATRCPVRPGALHRGRRGNPRNLFPGLCRFARPPFVV